MHDCLRHYFVVDRWFTGWCRCGCYITSPNLRKMLGNMIAGESRARSVVCMKGARMTSAKGGKSRRRPGEGR